jgi:gliding motility-associated-like protein
MRTTNLVKASCLAALLTLTSYSSKAQLRANFSATPLTGCAPLVVNFSDLSTGSPTTWRWDLGNGTTSSLRNPSVTYFNPGQYTIKLVVQNATGRDSLIRTQYISIFAKPTVNFSVSSNAGCFPMEVTFTDLSVAGSGSIDNWQWDFGDGTFSTLQNPSHIYTSAGNFNVSLRVRNNNGCFQNLTRTQLINVINGATANFTFSTPSSCAPPVNINLQNLSIGTGVLTYQWNFGDGGTSTQTNPSHTYTTSGTYTLQLIVTNVNGCRDTMRVPNAVVIGSSQSSFTIPSTACVNTGIPINNTSTTAVSTSWDFGDGTFSSAVNPLKSYTAPGNYTIKLVNNFGSCSDSLSQNISILPAPRAAFNANPLSSCQAPLIVNFNNTSTGATSYTWDFGDGTTSTQVLPSHSYASEGTYSVTLIATNNAGCSDTIVRSNYISIELPRASINDLPRQGCAPLTWTFTSTVTSPDPVVSYFWDFGDGTTSTDSVPTHTFAQGIFDIQLIIITASGCSDTVTVTSGVRAGFKPQAAFSGTPRNVCAETAVIFTDLSTPAGQITGWFWDFGDGGSSTLQNPEHTYNDTGYFPIMLIVFNNGCPDTLIVEDYIQVLPPIAIFSVVSNCNNKLMKSFTNRSIGADSYSWNFGDGTSDTARNPVHVYATTGIYAVSLTVFNNITGCSYTRTANVNVVDERAAFTASDTVICRTNTVTFTATGNNLANVASYRWTFGDGTFASNPTSIKRFNVSGFYTISLVVTDIYGCRDTLTKTDYITVNGPTSNFGTSIAGTCLLNSVAFTDSSTTDGRHPIVSWIWNYGDGNIDTLSSGPFQHTYSTSGIYGVSLTVIDNSGCSHRLIRPNLLVISQPVANFSTADTSTCPNRNVSFINSSTGPSLSYAWDFGDGNTSTLQNPVHNYLTNGNFTVKLIIYDLYGCSDTITRNNYVTIRTPNASFTVSDSIGTCPPLVVDFSNNSSNFTSQLWDFGDGTTSTTANPSHFYSIPGTYISKLTVTGPGGCTSEKIQTIIVRGPYGSFTYGGLSGCQPLTVNFRATTRDRASFIWDFNDGNTNATTDSIVSHTYTIPGEYLPKMILRDAAGCLVPIIGTDTIRVSGIIPDFSFNAQPICDQGTVQFNNNSSANDSITSYNWNFGDGGTSTSINPSHLYNTPGTYYPQLIMQSQLGCRDSVTSTIPVKVVVSPISVISQTANGCVDLTVTLTGNTAVPDTSAIQWNWDLGGGVSSTQQNPPVQNYTVAGNYPISLNVTNSSGCSGSSSTTVEAYAIPILDAGLDTMICMGSGTRLSASGAVTYDWSPSTGLSCNNCFNPIANPDSLTLYTVIGTSIHGCSSRDSVKVSVKYPFSMRNSNGDTLCLGESLRMSASGAYAYSWTPTAGLDNPASPTPIASPSITTLYRVIGWDDRNCFRDTAFIPVVVYNIPTVEAGIDRIINVGKTIDLIPSISSDVIDAKWTPTGSIFRNIFPGISVKPRETTTYRVEVSNQGGCTATDQLTVNVICNNANIFIPNTFSPNGDGNNDLFLPRGSGVFRISSMKIFTRWGEVVFEKSNFNANDISKAWDGTFKGRTLNPDVYVYRIDVVCESNEMLQFKGNVVLLK